MKVVIIHSDSEIAGQLADILLTEGHAVMALCSRLTMVGFVLTKYEPGAILIGGSFPQGTPEAIAQNIRSLQFQVRIHLLSHHPLEQVEINNLVSKLEGETVIWREAHAPSHERIVYLDLGYPTYNKFKEREKHCQEDETDWSTTVEKLAHQLHGGRQHLRHAQKYLALSRRSHSKLSTELTSRALHANFGLWTWQLQIQRYLAVLAFFTPNVDWFSFPKPVDVSPRVQFCPFELDVTGHYLINIMRSLGLQEHLLQNCISTLLTTYAEQEPSKLISIGIHFAGLAALLEEIAVAHVETLKRMLDPTSDFFSSGPPDPVHSRSEAIYLDAWGMGWLWHERKLWLAGVKAHHSNALPQVKSQTLSFRRFLGSDHVPPLF